MNPDQTIPNFLAEHGILASQQELKMRQPDGSTKPLQETAPAAAMRFETYTLAAPRPSAEDLLTCLECYFRETAVPAPEKTQTFQFGKIAEATLGGEDLERVGMFTVLYLQID